MTSQEGSTFRAKDHWVARALVAFLVGGLFALGLGVSGMTRPQKVIGFLDLASWDPSLIFVMIGAIGAHALLYPLIRRRPSPLLETRWHVPQGRDVKPRLLLGAAIFGVGWGLGGFCPGPGLVSLASLDERVVVFVISMAIGMFVHSKTTTQNSEQ